MIHHHDGGADPGDLPRHQPVGRRDRGFTLVELLIVIVILGILATVTVFAVRGITNKGQTNACATDKTTLQTAVESYFAQYGSSTGIASAAVSAAAAAPNGFPAGTAPNVGNPVVAAITAPTATPAWSAGANPGLSLVNAGFLRAAPTNFWVAQDGKLYSLSVNCGAVGTVVG